MTRESADAYGGERAAMSLQEYYAEPAVRAQIRRYCGVRPPDAPGAVFLKGLSPSDAGSRAQWELAEPVPVHQLEELLAMGADISRSLWDRDNLLVHLDIDYRNSDFAGEPFTHPAEAFSRLEPLYRLVRRETRRLQLPLLCLMTGRGYHFTGRVPLSAPVVADVRALVPAVPPWHATMPSRAPAWLADRITEHQARAHAGLGLLIEYLAHRLLRRAAPRTRVPIVFNGTVVGSGMSGRAAISLDFSFLGDPLDVRHIRVAFGGYQLHRLRPDLVGPRIAADVAPLVAVPRGPRAGLLPTLRSRQPSHAARVAARGRMEIPDVTGGVEHLLDAYGESKLAAFHRSFLDPANWPAETDELERRLEATPLPPCVTWPLATPNDLLLQPAFVQHVTRALSAHGWTAPEIASLVRRRYEDDHLWGNRWLRLDAATRAEFDVRVFAGLTAAGADDGIDFNCVSAQEKGLCPGGGCGVNLLDLRSRLLTQVPA
jgi:hypothetical protein